MKKIKFVILTLLILVSLSSNVFAIPQNPTSNLLSKGQYKVKADKGGLVPGVYKISLNKPDSIMYVYIIDKDCIERYSKRFDSTGLNGSSLGRDSALFSQGTLLEGDTVIVYGDGEIYIDYIKEK